MEETTEREGASERPSVETALRVLTKQVTNEETVNARAQKFYAWFEETRPLLLGALSQYTGGCFFSLIVEKTNLFTLVGEQKVRARRLHMIESALGAPKGSLSILANGQLCLCMEQQESAVDALPEGAYKAALIRASKNADSAWQAWCEALAEQFDKHTSAFVQYIGFIASSCAHGEATHVEIFLQPEFYQVFQQGHHIYGYTQEDVYYVLAERLGCSFERVSIHSTAERSGIVYKMIIKL